MSIKSAPSPETVVNTPPLPVSETEFFHEAHPPPKYSFSTKPDHRDLVQDSFSVPHSSISSADDELLVVTVEGKTSSTSLMPSLQPSRELQTPTGDHSLTRLTISLNSAFILAIST